MLFPIGFEETVRILVTIHEILKCADNSFAYLVFMFTSGMDECIVIIRRMLHAETRKVLFFVML